MNTFCLVYIVLDRQLFHVKTNGKGGTMSKKGQVFNDEDEKTIVNKDNNEMEEASCYKSRLFQIGCAYFFSRICHCYYNSCNVRRYCIRLAA